MSTLTEDMVAKAMALKDPVAAYTFGGPDADPAYCPFCKNTDLCIIVRSGGLRLGCTNCLAMTTLCKPPRGEVLWPRQ